MLDPIESMEHTRFLGITRAIKGSAPLCHYHRSGLWSGAIVMVKEVMLYRWRGHQKRTQTVTKWHKDIGFEDLYITGNLPAVLLLMDRFERLHDSGVEWCQVQRFPVEW